MTALTGNETRKQQKTTCKSKGKRNVLRRQTRRLWQQ